MEPPNQNLSEFQSALKEKYDENMTYGDVGRFMSSFMSALRVANVGEENEEMENCLESMTLILGSIQQLLSDPKTRDEALPSLQVSLAANGMAMLAVSGLNPVKLLSFAEEATRILDNMMDGPAGNAALAGHVQFLAAPGPDGSVKIAAGVVNMDKLKEIIDNDPLGKQASQIVKNKMEEQQ